MCAYSCIFLSPLFCFFVSWVTDHHAAHEGGSGTGPRRARRGNTDDRATAHKHPAAHHRHRRCCRPRFCILTACFEPACWTAAFGTERQPWLPVFPAQQADSSTSDGTAVFFCHVYGLTVTHDVSWFWPAACSRAGSGSPLCAEQRPAASSRAAGGTPRTSGAADDLPVFWSRSAARRPWAERSPVVLFFFRLVSGRRPRAELQSGLQVMFPGVIAVTRVQNLVGSVMTITSSYFHLHLRALPGSGGGIGRLPSPKDIMFAAGPIH